VGMDRGDGPAPFRKGLLNHDQAWTEIFDQRDRPCSITDQHL
jgi:hypothetical protein